jgi:nicotinamide-nucleotide amidase
VAITGIAGPSGGTKLKPVGLVYFAAASRDGQLVERSRRFGKIGRRRVRQRSVVEALALLQLLATAPAQRLRAVNLIGTALEGAGKSAEGGIEN